MMVPAGGVKPGLRLILPKIGSSERAGKRRVRLRGRLSKAACFIRLNGWERMAILRLCLRFFLFWLLMGIIDG